MDDQLESLTWSIHALTILLALFAVGSLLIATIGQYTAMAFTMRRRIRDFGVRYLPAHRAARIDPMQALREE